MMARCSPTKASRSRRPEVRLLLDTHLLLWIAEESRRLSVRAVKLIADEDNVLVFSTISVLEVAIKYGMRRPDFQVHPALLRRGLLDNGYEELAVTGEHAALVGDLPPIHKDPFDRLLLAQAMAEGITLVTGDAALTRYPGVVRVV